MDAQALTAARNRLGLNQSHLARRLGVSVNTVWRWEAGKLEIRHPVMLALALWALEHGAGEDDNGNDDD